MSMEIDAPAKLAMCDDAGPPAKRAIRAEGALLIHPKAGLDAANRALYPSPRDAIAALDSGVDVVLDPYAATLVALGQTGSLSEAGLGADLWDDGLIRPEHFVAGAGVCLELAAGGICVYAKFIHGAGRWGRCMGRPLEPAPDGAPRMGVVWVAAPDPRGPVTLRVERQ